MLGDQTEGAPSEDIGQGPGAQQFLGQGDNTDAGYGRVPIEVTRGNIVGGEGRGGEWAPDLGTLGYRDPNA